MTDLIQSQEDVMCEFCGCDMTHVAIERDAKGKSGKAGPGAFVIVRRMEAGMARDKTGGKRPQTAAAARPRAETPLSARREK